MTFGFQGPRVAVSNGKLIIWRTPSSRICFFRDDLRELCLVALLFFGFSGGGVRLTLSEVLGAQKMGPWD